LLIERCRSRRGCSWHGPNFARSAFPAWPDRPGNARTPARATRALALARLRRNGALPRFKLAGRPQGDLQTNGAGAQKRGLLQGPGIRDPMAAVAGWGQRRRERQKQASRVAIRGVTPPSAFLGKGAQAESDVRGNVPHGGTTPVQLRDCRAARAPQTFARFGRESSSKPMSAASSHKRMCHARAMA